MLNYSANGPSGYNLTRSVRLRRSASAYLNRTPGVAGNQKTYTFSFWYKRGLLTSQQGLLEGYVNSGTLTSFNINNDTFNFQIYNSPSYNVVWATTAVFRDPSSWYHVVLTIDTTQASQANMAKLYINGVQQTFTYTNYIGSIAQNTNTNINASGTGQYIGVYNYNGSYQDGYFAETYLIDGQALTPSSFGQTSSTTGVWIPKQYSGTYGTNGFYLPFTDNSSTTSGSNVGLGKDFSGNGNFFNTNNISVTAGTTYDSMTDVPTLTSTTTANYCVISPLVVNTGTDKIWKPINGNLSVTGDGVAMAWAYGSIAFPLGKWYFEATVAGTDSGKYAGLKVQGTNTGILWTADPTGNLNINGTTSSITSYTNGDVIAFAYDASANTISLYKNNVLVTGPLSWTATNAQTFTWSNSTTNNGYNFNFGQQGFKYTPPTGYVALNTYNLPDSTIVQGNKYMDATTYTGNSTTGRTISTNFYADFIWTKSRNVAYSNSLFDSVRGAGQSKNLVSNTAEAEGGGNSVYGNVSAFGSSAYTLAAGTDPGNPYANNNESGKTYVGWLWQAGQGTTSSNTNGTITSTVSVNASAGFSIVTYTGTGANATVGHGLGVAPKMVIIKNRSSGSLNWGVYNATVGNTKVLLFNTTAAASAADPSFWNNTSPTSTTFSLGTWPEVNNSGNSFVAYCWAEISGFSKFGSYTGNGSTDGVFIYTGFIPKFIIIKSSSNAYNWQTYDSARGVYNAIRPVLYPNLANAEYSVSTNDIDFVANGFKLRGSDAGINSNGATYIYMAFATNPFKNSNAF